MNNITKIIGGLVVAGGITVVATPLIYQKQIDKIIKQEKQILSQNNISLTEKLNKDSFFNIKREYIITLTDVAPIIKQVYPNITSYDLSAFQEAFNGTQFLLELDFSKFPISHKDAVKISLYKLNKNSNDYLKKDYAGKEILNFIKNKGLELIIDTNSLKIAKVRLKDIDLVLHKNQNSKDIIKFEVKNTYTNFKNSSTSTTNTDKIEFNLVSPKLITDIKLEKAQYTISKQNDFNYKTNTNIQNFSYVAAKKYFYTNNKFVKVTLTLNNIKSSSKVSAIVNNLSIENNLNIKKTQIENEDNHVSILVDNFTFNNKFEKLDLSSIKKIINTIQNSSNPNMNTLQQPIQTLINKGFTFKINPLSFDKIVINNSVENTKIDNLKLTLSTTLKPNDFKLNYNRPDYLLNYIDSDLNINTTKNNVKLLSTAIPISNLYLSKLKLVKTQNGVNINISYKNGKLTSNGKPIQ